MRRAAVFLGVVLLCAGVMAAQQPVAVREIKMTAKKYAFAPAEIQVKPGERVRLLVTATDRKHGFEIKELGVKTTLEKGQETPVEFVAGAPGTYEFRCSVLCGWGHRRMKGRLIVEPATPKP